MLKRGTVDAAATCTAASIRSHSPGHAHCIEKSHRPGKAPTAATDRTNRLVLKNLVVARLLVLGVTYSHRQSRCRMHSGGRQTRTSRQPQHIRTGSPATTSRTGHTGDTARAWFAATAGLQALRVQQQITRNKSCSTRVCKPHTLQGCLAGLPCRIALQDCLAGLPCRTASRMPGSRLDICTPHTDQTG